jgi:hypothetical protein
VRKEEWAILRRTGPDATPELSSLAKAGGMTAVESDEAVSAEGLGHVLRRVHDPVLLLLLPLGFAALDLAYGHGSVDVGFDFRGTLWEPARALFDGTPMYPEPTRTAVEIGNPAVYPPFAILVTAPFALLSASAASWVWFVALAAAVLASMWLVGVRDWRCLVLALTSPVVLQGLYWGNLTLALLLPLALAWRYRERATIVGVAVGSAVAAKLIAWPLVIWLLLTRRYRAACWATASAVVLVAGSWAVVGFEGMLDYPKLLRETQDVYATRSDSVAGVLGGLGASVTVAVACCWLAGLALVALAVWVARREDGDRKAFALLVGAAIVASPITWPNYAALLFVPIAVTWPRLAPAWFFGYAVWLAGMLPKPEAGDAPPRPQGVPAMVWDLSHATPAAGKALGIVVVVLAVTAALVAVRSARHGRAET